MSKKLDDALARFYDLLVDSGKEVDLDPLVEVFDDFLEARDELDDAVMKDNLTYETNLEHYYDILRDKIEEDMALRDHELNFIDINAENLMRKLGIDSRFYVPSTEILEWLASPYMENEPLLLDNTDTNYLTAIIKPYLNLGYDVKIRKVDHGHDMYNIKIQVTHWNDFKHTITLPPFNADEDMYTGMELRKWYKWKEFAFFEVDNEVD